MKTIELMVTPKSKLNEPWTVEEYLEFEKTSPVQHEYVDGQIYAMSGATKQHNRIVVALSSHLDQYLSDNQCEVFVQDVKVKVRETLYYYPDLVVSSEPPVTEDESDDYLAVNPILIVDVLSKTTARIDRIEKMNEYRNLAGLLEYIIIAQDEIQVEIYRHNQAGQPWEREIYTEPEEKMTFESIGAKVKLADIYRRVNFRAAPEAEEL